MPAGTVVDRGATNSDIYDFYMYAHAGIMGTSRPAHYVVLHDDNKLTGRSLQGTISTYCINFYSNEIYLVMSYYLSHCYARCTRTVAMPICVYYAQLIAERGRYYLRQLGYNDEG